MCFCWGGKRQLSLSRSLSPDDFWDPDIISNFISSFVSRDMPDTKGPSQFQHWAWSVFVRESGEILTARLLESRIFGRNIVWGVFLSWEWWRRSSPPSTPPTHGIFSTGWVVLITHVRICGIVFCLLLFEVFCRLLNGNIFGWLHLLYLEKRLHDIIFAANFQRESKQWFYCRGSSQGGEQAAEQVNVMLLNVQVNRGMWCFGSLILNIP